MHVCVCVCVQVFDLKASSLPHLTYDSIHAASRSPGNVKSLSGGQSFVQVEVHGSMLRL